MQGKISFGINTLSNRVGSTATFLPRDHGWSSIKELLFHCDLCRTAISSFVHLLFQGCSSKYCLTIMQNVENWRCCLCSVSKIQLLRLLHEKYFFMSKQCNHPLRDVMTESSVLVRIRFGSNFAFALGLSVSF